MPDTPRPKRPFCIERSPIIPARVRRIDGSFAFLPHRFLRCGFFSSLGKNELVLYVFLVLAADRAGVSFYNHERICSILALDPDDYLDARNGLIDKELVAFDGSRFQVLSLPDQPRVPERRALRTNADFEEHDPATIRALIGSALRPSRAR